MALTISAVILLQDRPGREPLSVAMLTERTHGESLDERRLAVMVDEKGLVRSVSHSPNNLFDFDPQALVSNQRAGPQKSLKDISKAALKFVHDFAGFRPGKDHIHACLI